MTAVTFPVAQGGNGLTYSDDGTSANDMQNGGHRTNLLAMLVQSVIMAQTAAASAVTAVNAPGTSGTSTTSIPTGTGSKTFATQSGKAWAVGQFVIVADTAAPTTNWMHGQIIAYDSSDGNPFTVNVTTATGSATIAAWTISLAPPVIGYNNVTYAAKAALFTAVLADRGAWWDCTGTWTLSLTAVATLTNGWFAYVANTGTGVITIDPNGAETINGAATLAIQSGETWILMCTGAVMQARLLSKGVTYNVKSGGYTAVAADNGGVLEFTAAATLAYTAVATLGDSWSCLVVNSSSGVITHDPNGAEAIAGATTSSQPAGSTWLVVADGGAFKVIVLENGIVQQNATAFTTGGTTAAFTLTPTTPLLGYAAGQRYRVKFHATGTSTATMNISGLGAKTLMQYNTAGVKINAVTAVDQLTDIEYDGVDLLVLDPLPGVSTYSIKIPTSATAGTLVKADSGKRVKITAAVLVPYNIFADEDVVMIYNNSAGALTITEDTAAGLVMRLSGTATTGNRTLAQRGTATIVFNSGSDCVITGAGLT